jgi:hypothetical protein
MLDQSGFQTELLEGRNVLGGGLIASAAPPHKDKLSWYLTYLERRLAQSRVQLRLNTFADLNIIESSRPDLVVLANGARTSMPPIEGIESALVHDAYEVLMGQGNWLPPPGSAPVVVYGGGETGCEAAEYVTQRGVEVLLVTRSPETDLARAAEPIYRGVLLKRLAENPRLRILERTHLVAIREAEVVLQSADGLPVFQKASRVLIAQGRRSDPTLANSLRAAGIVFESIGDARQGGRIGDAVRDAYTAVLAHCHLDRRTSSLAATQLAC